MDDVLSEKSETKNGAEVQGKVEGKVQAELWNAEHLTQLKTVLEKDKGQLPVLSEKLQPMPLPDKLNGSLQDLQKNLETTQQLLKDLRQSCDIGLYEREQSRLSLTGNPYKILTAGTGLALLTKSPAYGAVPLAGFAALQGYDDFKSLLNQESFAGRSKYTLGLLADASMTAGALGFLSESVPMRYKAPLLLGGLAVRTAVDFIPSKR